MTRRDEAIALARRGEEFDWTYTYSIGSRAGEPNGFRGVRRADGQVEVYEYVVREQDPYAGPCGTRRVLVWRPEDDH